MNSCVLRLKQSVAASGKPESFFTLRYLPEAGSSVSRNSRWRIHCKHHSTKPGFLIVVQKESQDA
jgi:hypothetical protein